MLRARDALVQVRTKLINCARGLVKSVGRRLPGASGEYFAKKVREHIPAELCDALTPVLDQIEQLSTQLRDYDKRIEQVAKTDYAPTTLMRQIPGVGAITSLAFTLTIEDPHRFGRSRDIAGYLRLLPRQGDSGGSKPQLSITKAGDGAVREVLVQAALTLLTRVHRWSALKAWGMAVAKRRGLRRAIVAVARKLAIIMHRMWADTTTFNWSRETVALA